MTNIFIGLGFILFIGFGIFQLVIGYQGIEYHLGAGWAIAALACTFIFRFTLPITIGTYFGVVDVLEWHWAIGLLVAAPGLLFMVPSIALAAFEPIMSKFSRKKPAYQGHNNDYGQVIDVDPIEENNSENAVKTGKEVAVTIAALKNLRPEYDSEGIYHSPAVDDVFKQAEKVIRADKKDVIEGIAKDRRDPAEIALTALWNVSNQEVSMGHHHVYRGVLSGRGQGYLYVYNKTVDVLLDKGFIDEKEAESNRKTIQTNIKAAG
ncbi:MAG: hypothetical protein GC137_10350 [Alphaproteobacteria bacterium]|nr:hypothetical protein [Alphaproteobacteria bacterium]